jgi:hypothetical protein
MKQQRMEHVRGVCVLITHLLKNHQIRFSAGFDRRKTSLSTNLNTFFMDILCVPTSTNFIVSSFSLDPSISLAKVLNFMGSTLRFLEQVRITGGTPGREKII